jgi:DNA-binding response OmpR family regulator
LFTVACVRAATASAARALELPIPIPSACPTPNAPVVVVTEDDADIRAMVVRAEATELLGAIPTPAAMVCDVMMPGLSGLQLVRNLRKDPSLARIPVLFLTAKSTPRDVVSGINAGARHYMTKPFKLAELISKVDSMVTGKK